jgi:hypothetical protein
MNTVLTEVALYLVAVFVFLASIELLALLFEKPGE